jgi:hypothetical protein
MTLSGGSGIWFGCGKSDAVGIFLTNTAKKIDHFRN